MNRQSGFTLIEISIVLVIIGLLLGGVLKGQELIENAKIKRMNNDFSGIATAAYSYLDRYSSIPGDDADAAARWSTTAIAPTGTADNGVINGAWSSRTPADESYLFWIHLRKSNLITGGDDTKLPVHAFGGKIGVANGDSTTYLGLSGPVICMDNISGKRAEIIDKQLDDGKPAGGVLRGKAGTDPSGTVSTETSYAQDTIYSICKQM